VSASPKSGASNSPAFEIVDPQTFLKDGMFRQDDFLSALSDHDWSAYAGMKVLVRGCGSEPIPPWAYMAIAARLTGIADSIRYGNEHDHVVIWRAKKT
jgi:hypothetical protein